MPAADHHRDSKSEIDTCDAADPGRPDPAATRGSIGTVQGTMLYVGAVLGSSVLLVPALAMRKAGPASVVAWAALILLSIPLAYTFAGVATRFPGAGGVAGVAERAFGSRASVCVGWTMYGGALLCVPSQVVIGARYVADGMGAGDAAAVVAALTILACVLAANYAGVQTSSTLQVLFTGGLSVLLVLTLVAVAPDARAENWEPFAPNGWWSVGLAASVVAFAFSGWEVVTPLSAEFRDPMRGIARATRWALIITGVIYLGLGIATVGVLGDSAAGTHVPIADLMDAAFGDTGRFASTAVAVMLTLGSANAYIGGAAKLGAALARDGALPAPLARGHETGRTPVRSLALITACTVPLAVGFSLHPTAVEAGLTMAAACFVAVYVYGCAAAYRLATGPRGRATSATAGVLALGLLTFSGPALVAPLIPELVVALASRRRRSSVGREFRSVSRPPTEADTEPAAPGSESEGCAERPHLERVADCSASTRRSHIDII